MLLSILLKDVEVLNEYDDSDIKNICCNTNQDVKSSAFVCIKGESHNGNDYAKLALQRGAAAVITDQSNELSGCVLVSDARKAYALMCKAFYENPQNELFMVATTGTNGKTSVTTITGKILQQSGIEAGVITTIGASYNNYSRSLSNTTPDSHTLYDTIAEMKNRGCKAICLEASSHALTQQRLAGINFDVAIFTNLTKDHLDYHNDMEDYYNAKKLLFSQASYAVINLDDPYGERLTKEIAIDYDTFSTKNNAATYFADDIVYSESGVAFSINYGDIKTRINFKIPGIYSVQNVLAATAAARHKGISFETIANAVASVEGIMGRNEVVACKNGVTVLCDFAHTPDGLRSIIEATKAYAKGRVIVLFGCGGDRDQTKRPIMGEVATSTADFTVITSDNPRSERKDGIINDILKGVIDGKKYIAIEDRTEAIRYAISIAKPNDIVILAGKGHELYCQLGDKKLFYDERKVVKGILSSLEQSPNM